jgi:hypothetical protein
MSLRSSGRLEVTCYGNAYKHRTLGYPPRAFVVKGSSHRLPDLVNVKPARISHVFTARVE